MQESVKGSEKAGFGQLFLFQNLNLKKSTGLPPRSSAPQRFKALPQHHLTPPLSSPAPHRPAPTLPAQLLIAPAPPLSAPGLIIPAPPLSAQRFNASAAPASSAFKATPRRRRPCALSPHLDTFDSCVSLNHQHHYPHQNRSRSSSALRISTILNAAHFMNTGRFRLLSCSLLLATVRASQSYT